MSAALEAAIKAAQTADLLVQDLQELNGANPLLSLFALPKIAEAVKMRSELRALANALETEP